MYENTEYPKPDAEGIGDMMRMHREKTGRDLSPEDAAEALGRVMRLLWLLRGPDGSLPDVPAPEEPPSEPEPEPDRMSYLGEPPYCGYLSDEEGLSDEDAVYRLLPWPPALRLGYVGISREAGEAMDAAGQDPLPLLARHAMADPGGNRAARQKAERAARRGREVSSSYLLQTGERVVVTTDADRQVTSIYLPGCRGFHEYLTGLPPAPQSGVSELGPERQGGAYAPND